MYFPPLYWQQTWRHKPLKLTGLQLVGFSFVTTLKASNCLEVCLLDHDTFRSLVKVYRMNVIKRALSHVRLRYLTALCVLRAILSFEYHWYYGKYTENDLSWNRWRLITLSFRNTIKQSTQLHWQTMEWIKIVFSRYCMLCSELRSLTQQQYWGFNAGYANGVGTTYSATVQVPGQRQSPKLTD